MPNVTAPLLQNSLQIRHALGPVLDFIRVASKLVEERNETKRLKHKMWKHLPHVCAACRMSFSDDMKAEAAHICALEEGATTTEDNLVLLCKECHKLYDKGFASLMEMREASALWRANRVCKLRSKMDERLQSQLPVILGTSGIPREREIYALQTLGHFLQALKILNEPIYGEDEERKALSDIIRANIERRRSAQSSLHRCVGILLNTKKDKIPRERLPLYFYELGYVHQLL